MSLDFIKKITKPLRICCSCTIKCIAHWIFQCYTKQKINFACSYFQFPGGCPNSWMSTVKISWITRKEICWISCRLYKSKSGTFWVKPVRDTILEYAETSKETIFGKGINCGFVYVVYCPNRHPVFLSFHFCGLTL